MRDRKPPSFVAEGSAVSARTRTAHLTGRAILMVLAPSVLPLRQLTSCELLYCHLLILRTCLYCCGGHPGPPPRPAASPVARPTCPARLGTPLHGLPSTRARSPAPLLRSCLLQPLVTANRLHLRLPRYRLPVAPDHCGPPGTAASPVTVLHLPWLRNSAAVPHLLQHTHLPGVQLGTARTASSPTAVPLVAAPDHCGLPGPAAGPVAVLHQPWLQNPTTVPRLANFLTAPASSCLAGLSDFWLREKH